MVNPRLPSVPNTGAISGILEGFSFLGNPAFAKKRFEKHGNIFETSLFGQPMVFVQGSQAISDLLSNPNAIDGWWPRSVQQLLGSHSLANRNGAAHKARRRAVAQLFSASALQDYSPGIIKMVEDLAEELKCATRPIPLAERMRCFAFSVIASSVLGLEGTDRDELFLDFEIWTKALFSIPIALPGSPFAKALKARNRLLMRLQKLLSQSGNFNGGLDLLSRSSDEAGIPLTDEDIVEQLLLLLFAGYETTASALSCLMRELLVNPSVERWLRDELDQLYWPPDPQSSSHAYDQSNAPRLNAVVNEVMRLTPPVGGFFRRTKLPVVIDGILVPENRVVQVALISSNRHGIGDLDTFRPQRHIDNDCPVKLIPFGDGERVCLGKSLAELEIRLMVVGLFRKVRLALTPNQDLSLRQLPSPIPRDGLLVEVDEKYP